MSGGAPTRLFSSSESFVENPCCLNMWNHQSSIGPSFSEKPLALQSLDHSQLYLRRAQHFNNEHHQRDEDVIETSPTMGDYEDLSEQDWTEDHNSMSATVWSSPSQNEPPTNVAPLLPPRSSAMSLRSSISKSDGGRRESRATW